MTTVKANAMPKPATAPKPKAPKPALRLTKEEQQRKIAKGLNSVLFTAWSGEAFDIPR